MCVWQLPDKCLLSVELAQDYHEYVVIIIPRYLIIIEGVLTEFTRVL